MGQGAFGLVRLAKHKQTGRMVAIKVVDKHTLARNPAWLQSILQEQQILRKLNDCSSTVNLVASFHDRECVYLVLECCWRGDLQHAIEYWHRSSPHDHIASTAAVYGGRLRKAIMAIHQLRVIHADLKPDNILLAEGGDVRITDFGAAIDMDDMRVLRTWQGASAFASPEIIAAQPAITPAADWWSFGCILHALCIGHSPFHADSDALVVERIQEFTQTPSISILSPKLPNQWRELCQRLLEPSPTRRLDGDSSHPLDDNLQWDLPFETDMQKCILDVPPPRWLQDDHQAEFRDGGLGWSSYLLD